MSATGAAETQHVTRNSRPRVSSSTMAPFRPSSDYSGPIATCRGILRVRSIAGQFIPPVARLGWDGGFRPSHSPRLFANGSEFLQSAVRNNV